LFFCNRDLCIEVLFLEEERRRSETGVKEISKACYLQEFDEKKSKQVLEREKGRENCEAHLKKQFQPNR
jgi:hypothetical protein